MSRFLALAFGAILLAACEFVDQGPSREGTDAPAGSAHDAQRRTPSLADSQSLPAPADFRDEANARIDASNYRVALGRLRLEIGAGRR